MVASPLEVVGTVLSNFKVSTLALPNKKFLPILRVAPAESVPPNLNSSASLLNLVKLGLLKLAKLLKVNEAGETGPSPVLPKLPNLLRVVLLSAKFGSFTMVKLAKLVKALWSIVKLQVVGRVVLAEADASVPALVKPIMLNLVFWKALTPIEVNAVAPVKLVVLSVGVVDPRLSFLSYAILKVSKQVNTQKNP